MTNYALNKCIWFGTLSVLGIIVWWQLSFKNFVPLTISTFETSNSCFHEIDVVYTWVNGSCPEFQKSLKKEMAKLGKNNLTVQGTMAARFYDWDTMKYSIRSVEMFAPCMRNLYIVTNGQSPDWLNLSNPKVTLVKHVDRILILFGNLLPKMIQNIRNDTIE